MNHAALVVSTRGVDEKTFVENVFYGSVAVVDHEGTLVHALGDVTTPMFSRSTLKPLQALMLVESGAAARYAFDSADLALACASHSGEPRHVERAKSLLDRAGLDESHLQCGAQVPIFYTGFGVPPPAGERFGALHNNCSGKHSAFLCTCTHLGLAVGDYLDPAHKLQQAIRQQVAQCCEIDAAAMPMGFDGCSAPNYALPLRNLALGFAKLAVAGTQPGGSSALNLLCEAMITHPEMVSGKGRGDALLMQAGAGDWVTKAGAEAMQLIGVRSRGWGIAIKISDGNARALGVATLEVLRQLGLWPASSEGLPAELKAMRRPILRNLAGRQTGTLEPILRLT